MTLGLIIGGVAAAYLLFAAFSVGLPERLWLALLPISLERIPDRAARRHGDRVLFTTDEPCAWSVPRLAGPPADPRQWSASRIRATAGYLATLLRERFDLRHGERVAILKENHLDLHLLQLGIVRAGGVACPMNGAFAASKVEHYLRNIDARILFTDARTLLSVLDGDGGLGGVTEVVLVGRRADLPEPMAERLTRMLRAGVTAHWIEDLLAAVDHETAAVGRGKREVLYLVHSSGTTGFPKAVILRNEAQAHAMRGWLCYVHVSRRRDKGYLAVPNNHQAVILSFNCLLLAGIPAHWTTAYGRDGFDPAGVVRELAAGRYTGFFGFPIVYTQLKEIELARHELKAMRFWASTADAAHEQIIKPFAAVGSVFTRLGLPVRGSVYLDAQGSSEVGTPSVLRYYTRFTRRYERRVGRRHSTPFGPKVRIARDGRTVKRGEAGRLEVRGKTVFEAYWNNHTMTIAAIRDGWFFTGDVARFSADGHVVQLDREVDVIHAGDGDVYSLLIEEKVHKHPAVYDACVYGARQPDGTQLPAAAIAVRAEHVVQRDRLHQELNQLLGPAEQLARVDVLAWEDFPVGVTGKTLKRVFRERTEPHALPEANRPIHMRDLPGQDGRDVLTPENLLKARQMCEAFDTRAEACHADAA